MPVYESQSFNVFLNAIGERQRALSTALRELTRVVTLSDDAAKKVVARRALDASLAVKELVSGKDVPEWLPPLENTLGWYIANIGDLNAGLQLMNELMARRPAVEAHKWDFGVQMGQAPAVEFSRVFKESYDASRAPELFETLVGQLEAIVTSGEVDSVRTIRSLERLIATIRANMKRDYFSVVGAWGVVRIFMRKLAIEGIESVPGLKQLWKASRGTMEELDVEIANVQESVRIKVVASLQADLPMIESQAINVLPLLPTDVSAEAHLPAAVK